jgi:hypothetical protein
VICWLLGVGNPGFAWYIQGYLAPELFLQRGITYSFRVEGGNNPSNIDLYHPFVISREVTHNYTFTSLYILGIFFPKYRCNGLIFFKIHRCHGIILTKLITMIQLLLKSQRQQFKKTLYSNIFSKDYFIHRRIVCDKNFFLNPHGNTFQNLQTLKNGNNLKKSPWKHFVLHCVFISTLYICAKKRVRQGLT